MAWSGSRTASVLSPEKVYYFIDDTFDADGEVSTSLDWLASMKQAKLPTRASMYVTATHATAVTDVVQIDLEGSVDGNRWDQLISITDADADNGGTASEDSAISHADLQAKAYRYFRVDCVTVGLGNTLTAKVLLSV